jgi:NADPH-dependent 2,4-dienoyl-CoA reductase/sulfur reductase-like enzyme
VTTAAFDVVVVGAGPAGMAAAAAASTHRLTVLVIDEQGSPGGQIYRGIERSRHDLGRILGADYMQGRELVTAFRASGAAYWPDTTVWYVSPGLEIATATSADAVRSLNARRLIVATGAYERPFPVPGWTLPGVITAGAAQIMLKTGAAVPEGRVVMAGTGPLLYLVANQLLAAGCGPLAVLDTAPRGSFGRALGLFPRALAAPSQLAKGVRLLARTRARAQPYVRGVERLAIRGGDRAETVELSVAGGTRSLAADWVILHHGVIPNVQITMALQCQHAWDPAQLCWKPECDEWGRTSVANVRVAGDGAGIAGAAAAECSGTLAALQCAHELGRLTAAERDALASSWRSRLAPHRALRPWLDRMYQPAPAFRVPEGETLVCRCEEVSAGAIEHAVALGCLGPNQLKFFTRCGMGPCQGRMCGVTVSELIAAKRGVPVSEVGYYRVRQPLKPVTLAMLAQTAQPIAKAIPYKT